MSRISRAFKKGKTLITFIMAGDPSLASAEKLILDLEKSGADIIEIGIPFSDSIADGPVIVEAANRAIKKDVSAKDCIKLVSRIRKQSRIPLIFMTSYNIVHSYGDKQFISDASKAGVDGLILPDLPIDDSKVFVKEAKRKKLDVIFLLAPNSPVEHIKHVAKTSGGFIYMVSVTGITGKRKSFSSDIGNTIKKVRKFTKKPVAIGFGISNAEQARKASRLADGIIVGSAIVDMARRRINNVGGFVSRLKAAL